MVREKGLANPYVDSQFKLIFDEKCTKAFLESILNLKSPIKELQIVNSESNDYSTVGKRVYFDVVCEDEDGNGFIVEMQRVWQAFLKDRLLYYTCRKINDMGHRYEKENASKSRSSWTYDLKKVYTICLLDDKDRDTPEQVFRQDISLYDVDNGRIWNDKMNIIVINLKMIDKEIDKGNAEYYEKLLLLLDNISKDMQNAEDLLAEIDESTLNEEQKDLLRRVVNLSDMTTMTKEQKIAYDEALFARWDYDASMNESFKNGVAEGEARGEARGKAEERDKAEEEKLESAKKLKAMGLSNESISIALNIPIENL